MTRKWEGGVRVPAVDEKKLEKPSKNVQPERAFTFFTDFDDENKFQGSYIDIEGEELRALIRGVLENYPGIISEARVISLAGPFEALVHNWDALLAAALKYPAASEKEMQAKEDLDLLLDSVMKSRELEDYFQVREAHLTAKVTAYDWQWTLFCPGTLVYAEPCLGQPQLLIVDSIGSAPVRSNDERPDRPWIVTCASLDWNGSGLVRTPYVFSTSRYRGTKSVRTLQCYPVEYYQSVDTENSVESETCVKDSDDHKDVDFRNKSYGNVPVQLWELLVNRGKKFCDLSNSGEGRKRMFRYDGQALFNGFGISSSRSRPDV